MNAAVIAESTQSRHAFGGLNGSETLARRRDIARFKMPIPKLGTGACKLKFQGDPYRFVGLSLALFPQSSLSPPRSVGFACDKGSTSYAEAAPCVGAVVYVGFVLSALSCKDSCLCGGRYG